LVVWDVIGEQGLFRLKGHTNQITGVQFIGENEEFILSSSKDGFLKIWSFEIQHCLQTLVGHE
jgi:U3 small nucleolar RNA-associated protein 12